MLGESPMVYVRSSRSTPIVFHMIGDGHQPCSRGLHTDYKEFLLNWHIHVYFLNFLIVGFMIHLSGTCFKVLTDYVFNKKSQIFARSYPYG